MVYTHVLNPGGRGVRSPLDSFPKAVSSESGGMIRAGRRPKTGRKVIGHAEVAARKMVADPFASATSS
jgi:hypothetical protein